MYSKLYTVNCFGQFAQQNHSRWGFNKTVQEGASVRRHSNFNDRNGLKINRIHKIPCFYVGIKHLNAMENIVIHLFVAHVVWGR